MKHDVVIIDSGFDGKAAIAKVFTEQKQSIVVIDDAIPYVNPYANQKIPQVLKECKGRHTYVQKGQHETTNGFIVHEWVCKNCGHQI